MTGPREPGQIASVQERAVAAVRVAAKVEPSGREVGGEGEHLPAGGTCSFFGEPELEPRRCVRTSGVPTPPCADDAMQQAGGANERRV